MFAFKKFKINLPGKKPDGSAGVCPNRGGKIVDILQIYDCEIGARFGPILLGWSRDSDKHPPTPHMVNGWANTSLLWIIC